MPAASSRLSPSTRLRPPFAIAAGALVTITLALGSASMGGPSMADVLSAKAKQAIADTNGAPVTADFHAINGWPSRHPLLSGGEELDEQTRAAIAQAVADIPGIGGIRWADGTMAAESGVRAFKPVHCQDDVEALLSARTLRFEESSSAMDAASKELLDEVEDALRPCLGSIIAITGHTDNSGPEPGNLQLSKDRANAVRAALINRGIPADGLRAVGVGSSQPVEGLAEADPANRRIEFSVIATEPLKPTPVDTPGAR